MADTKALQGVEIKDAAKGTVKAVFSRFNVKDLDGDVTREGAFDDGAAVRISAYGHASWGPSRGASFVPMPPVGRGVIRVTKDEAILEGQFFMKTAAGADTFELVKEMGDLQEWSYGYDVLESEKGKFQGEPVRFLDKLIAHEVSPVLLGAGVGTRTLAVKGQPEDEDPEEPDEGGEEPKMIATYGQTPFGISTPSAAKARTFSDDAEHALASVEAFVARSRSLADLRGKEGRTLSAANRNRLAALAEALGASTKEISELLADSDPNKHRDELAREWLRFEHVRAQL